MILLGTILVIATLVAIALFVGKKHDQEGDTLDDED